jgi:hypothetical protein
LPIILSSFWYCQAVDVVAGRAGVCGSPDQARLSDIDTPVEGLSTSHSPFPDPVPKASTREQTDLTLRLDDPLDDRDRLDRIDNPLNKLATSARKDDA